MSKTDFWGNPAERDLLAFAVKATELAPQWYPSDDSADEMCGARFIPVSVTRARRVGQPVSFNQNCHNYNCWYWEFHDINQVRIPVERTVANSYHGHMRMDCGYEIGEDGRAYTYSQGKNHIKPGERIYYFDRNNMIQLQQNPDSKCPNCGNTHFTGQTAEGVELA